MTKPKIAVLISGQGSNMAALLYATKHPDCPYDIVLVASNNPDAPGLKLAEAEGIATFAQTHIHIDRAVHDAMMHDRIVHSGATHVALAGYMRILSVEFVQRWEGKMLNIHPSLLPKYKGLNTHKHAIDAGDKVAGCSVHLVTAQVDDGEVLGQTEVAIIAGDTPETLAERVKFAEHQLYPKILAEFVMRERTPEWVVDQVRQRAMQLPEADEVLSHGMPCFGIIKGKKFAYVARNHHEDGKLALLVKISGGEEQATLIEMDADRYYRPAYFGDGWIGMRLDLGDNDWDDIGDWLARSWRSIASKKLSVLHDIIGNM